MKKHWEEKLDEILKVEDHFGHNTEVDIKKYLRKIEKICSQNGRVDEIIFCEIDIVNDYAVKITLPPDYHDGCKWREDVLMHILTTTPMPTECRFNKKKDQLTVEWHY